jgi:hypothetical protein
MPTNDVTVKAVLETGSGQTLDTDTTTITSTASNDDGDSGSGSDSGSGDDDDDDSSITDLLNGLKEAFTESLEDNLASLIEDGLTMFLVSLFEEMLSMLVEALAQLLLWTPDVHPNPAVEDVHRDTLLITYSLTGLGVAVTGILYMTGPLFGISYQQIRPLIPRLVVALIFATISLHLLQYAVDFTQALTTAFQPDQPDYRSLAGLSTGLIIALLVNMVLVIALVILFIIRGVYILFVAAISPLLAFMWVFPKARRYADTFIAGWWAALLMAPLDMLVLKFLIALMQSGGASLGQAVTNWMYGMAGFVLLLFIPYQLYGAGQAGVGAAHSWAYGAVGTASQALRERRQGTTGTGQRQSGRGGPDSRGSRPLSRREYDPESGEVTPENNKFHTAELEDQFTAQEISTNEPAENVSGPASQPPGKEPAEFGRQERLNRFEADDEPTTDSSDGGKDT